MGPPLIKKDIYDVMTNSRELTNYCQESVKSFHDKRISDSLNNLHLKTSIDFISNALTHEDRFSFEFNKNCLDDINLEDNNLIYNKVIAYIENYLLDSDS